MRRLALLLVLVLAAAGPARSEEKKDWKSEPAWREFLKLEAKALAPLLRSALKEDYRRQAWYLADRILAADPEDPEAAKVLEQWTDDQLLEGMVPKAAWLQKTRRTLEERGDQWFHYGEMLNGAGVDPVDYYEVNVRAHAYGSRASVLLAAIEQEGQVWCETFGDPKREEVDRALGPDLPFESVVFPPEFDDDYLKIRVRWPAAKVVAWRHWRIFTDLPPLEALRLLGVLASAETFFARNLGSSLKAGKEVEHTDFLLFLEAKDYDKIGEGLVAKHPEPVRKDFAGSTWFELPWDRRVLATWRDRNNGWIGDDAPFLRAALPEVARRHLGADVRSRPTGRGSWLLDGLAGAFEGFARPEKGDAEVDPGRCWLLAAAKALREDGALLAWPDLMEVDREKAKATPRRAAKVEFRGGTFEAKEVDVVEAQATALVTGILKADGGKAGKRLGTLIEDLFKRDSLPDLEKALGWKKGRVFTEADTAIEAAHGR